MPSSALPDRRERILDRSRGFNPRDSCMRTRVTAHMGVWKTVKFDLNRQALLMSPEVVDELGFMAN